jgi:hypothetical protein
MAQADTTAPRRVRLFLATERKDAWWAPQLLTLAILTTFIVYATWAALQGDHYTYGPYLSPFYSPEIFGTSQHAVLGPPPSFWPSWLKFSPALLILPFPGGFRLTCYYYRGAYYKAFWADPPGCTVGEPRKSYIGESALPLIVHNIHRYFLYAAVVILAVLAWDALQAFHFDDGFGIGVGTLLLSVNAVLLGCYTFGCHSMRHLIGGRRDILPKGPVGKSCYGCVGALNRRHMIFAWASLISVMSSDVYVRLCSMGILHDIRII